MTKVDVLREIERLRSSLLLMDTRYRAERNKYTPVEIQDTLKALRMISLSIEANGLADCFDFENRVARGKQTPISEGVAILAKARGDDLTIDEVM